MLVAGVVVNLRLSSETVTFECLPASIFTSCNWLPFTASVEVEDTSPAFKLVIVVPPWPSKVTLFLLTVAPLRSYLTARSVNLSNSVLDAILLIVTVLAGLLG